MPHIHISVALSSTYHVVGQYGHFRATVTLALNGPTVDGLVFGLPVDVAAV